LFAGAHPFLTRGRQPIVYLATKLNSRGPTTPSQSRRAIRPAANTLKGNVPANITGKELAL
jgi:hypothetical protein